MAVSEAGAFVGCAGEKESRIPNSQPLPLSPPPAHVRRESIQGHSSSSSDLCWATKTTAGGSSQLPTSICTSERYSSISAASLLTLKPNQFAAHDDPKAESCFLWAVQINGGIWDRMEISAVHSAWRERMPQPLGSESQLSSCFHPAQSHLELLILKPNKAEGRSERLRAGSVQPGEEKA